MFSRNWPSTTRVPYTTRCKKHSSAPEDRPKDYLPPCYKFPAFSFDKLDFLCMSNYSGPGSNVFYTIQYGNESTTLRLAIANSVKI